MKTESQHKQFQTPSAPRRREGLADNAHSGIMASAGRFQLPGARRTYPKVQIFTVEDYFAGKRPDLPDTSDTLKKAKRIQKDTGQRRLEL